MPYKWTLIHRQTFLWPSYHISSDHCVHYYCSCILSFVLCTVLCMQLDCYNRTTHSCNLTYTMFGLYEFVFRLFNWECVYYMFLPIVTATREFTVVLWQTNNVTNVNSVCQYDMESWRDNLLSPVPILGALSKAVFPPGGINTNVFQALALFLTWRTNWFSSHYKRCNTSRVISPKLLRWTRCRAKCFNPNLRN